MYRILTISLFITALAFFGGCQSTQTTKTCKCDPCTCGDPCPCISQATKSTLNDACPMSGRAITASSPSSDWQGQKVGFCCGGCKNRFEGMTAQDKASMINDMQSNQS